MYHDAGVRCLALEVCTHEDNEIIEQLITASEYDQELALKIARNQPWQSWGGKEYWDIKGPESKMSNFIERIMAARDHNPVGFDVIDSPLMLLRDSTTYYFHFQPNVCFGDVTSGYIYLEPVEMFQKCQGVEGFITSQMFAKFKPFYEGRA